MLHLKETAAASKSPLPLLIFQERGLRRRQQTSEISLTSDMSDAVAAALRKSGASSSVKPADAGADAAAVGVVQEDVHTSVLAYEDQAVSNESVNVELPDK